MTPKYLTLLTNEETKCESAEFVNSLYIIHFIAESFFSGNLWPLKDMFLMALFSAYFWSVWSRSILDSCIQEMADGWTEISSSSCTWEEKKANLDGIHILSYPSQVSSQYEFDFDTWMSIPAKYCVM